MIILGKYYEIYKSNEYPHISDDIHQPCDHKEKIIRYMKSCMSSSSAPAVLTDVITGENINIPLEFKSDGVYGWRTDYIVLHRKI